MLRVASLVPAKTTKAAVEETHAGFLSGGQSGAWEQTESVQLQPSRQLVSTGVVTKLGSPSPPAAVRPCLYVCLLGGYGTAFLRLVLMWGLCSLLSDLPASRKRQLAAICMIPDEPGSHFFEESFFKSRSRTGYTPDALHPEPSSDDKLSSSFRHAVDRAYPEAAVAFSKDFGRLSSEGVGHLARDFVSPQKGCVLIATRKLDRHPLYSRSVILLTEAGDDEVRGVVLNKPLPPSLAKRSPFVRDIACDWTEAVHGQFPVVSVGGSPLSAHSLTVLTSTKGLRGFDRLIPGLYAGDNSVSDTVLRSCSSGYMMSADVRFFVGGVRWALTDLLYQIDVCQWWEVAEGRSEEVRLYNVARMWESFDTTYSREVKPEGICRCNSQETKESSNVSHKV